METNFMASIDRAAALKAMDGILEYLQGWREELRF
jgi:hypothetical protein